MHALKRRRDCSTRLCLKDQGVRLGLERLKFIILVCHKYVTQAWSLAQFSCACFPVWKAGTTSPGQSGQTQQGYLTLHEEQSLMKKQGSIKTWWQRRTEIHSCLFSHKNRKLHQIAQSTSHLQVSPARIWSSALPPQQHLVLIRPECGSGTVRQDLNANLTRRQHIEGQNWLRFQEFLQHFWRSLQPKPTPV